MKIIIEKPSEQKLKDLDVFSWPIWQKEPSTFPWHYDQQEICYFLEGEVTVMAEGEQFSFGAGDLVTFPKGMDCEWQITKAVRKHYKFF